MLVAERVQKRFYHLRIMSISALLALSNPESSKEDLLEAMPALSSNCSSEVEAVPQYCITLGAGPQSWS